MRVVGLLAVELGVYLSAGGSSTLSRVLAVVFFIGALLFVYRSFYGMRIEVEPQTAGTRRPVAVKA